MNRFFAVIAALVVAAAVPVRADISPRQIYQKVGPGVVLIMAVNREGSGEIGTGSIIDSTGYILTNAHVILRAPAQEPYEIIHVYLKPAKVTGDPKRDMTNPLRAKVKSYDRAIDLALLELEEKPSVLTTVPLGDASTVESGDPVVAIGHPEQGGLWTLTQGVVSTVIADLGGVSGKDVFQTDASINRGNSGGPLLNSQGAMIGVNTSMARKAADGLTITSVNFSIKSDVVKGWLAKNGPEVHYSETGVVSEKAQPPLPASVEPAPAKPAPAPTIETPPAPAPVAAAPEPKPIEPAVQAPPAPKPATPAPVQSAPKILTPLKPFHAQDLIHKEISAMEDMEKEMQGEIEKRRSSAD